MSLDLADRPPPFRWATPRTPGRLSYGQGIADLSTTGGRPLMPWQRHVVDVGTELLPDTNRWAYPVVVVHVQRQAGKTAVIGPKALHRGLLCRCRPCRAGVAPGPEHGPLKPNKSWLTAQTRQDARDTWVEVADLVETTALRAIFSKVRRSNGSESITGPTRSTFRVFAPDGDGLHGKANEDVDVDEAWAFDAAEGAQLLQAVLPTFTTTGGQLWIFSTAGTNESVWLRNYVDRGRAAVEAGRTTGLAYFECSLDDAAAVMVAAGLDPDNDEITREQAFDLVLAAHPAAGHTLDRSALEQAADEMMPGEFLRAYGNVWTATTDRLIPAHVWDARRWRDDVDGPWSPPAIGTLSLAFAIAVDRSESAILAGWRDTPVSPMRYDVIDVGPGDDWLAARLVQLRDKWRPGPIGYNGAGAALDVADQLERLGVELHRLDGREYAAACAGFLSSVVNARMTHRGAGALDLAVEAAANRPLGDGGWAWSLRKSAGSIAALEAATVVGWTYDHRPPPPTKPAIVGPRNHRPPAPSRSPAVEVITTPANHAGKARALHPG